LCHYGFAVRGLPPVSADGPVVANVDQAAVHLVLSEGRHAEART
jgi:hypothetical protein